MPFHEHALTTSYGCTHKGGSGGSTAIWDAIIVKSGPVNIQNSITKVLQSPKIRPFYAATNRSVANGGELFSAVNGAGAHHGKQEGGSRKNTVLFVQYSRVESNAVVSIVG